MNDERQVKRFEKEKLLKWWAQSFALGVRRIMVGFRDDRGKVVKTQMLETLKLPGYVAKHKGAWSVKVALRCASVVLTKVKELLSSEPSGTRVRVEYDPKKSQHRVNIIKDDSIPEFLPAEAREKLMNDGSWHESAPRAKPTLAPAGSEARDSAPEISETASAMSIRARTEVTNRIDYIRSLGPAALLYMQGKDPRRTLPGRVDDDTMGGIGMDPSAWMQQTHPGASLQGNHAVVSAHKMAPTASAGKAQSHAPSAAAPSLSGVRDAKSAAEDNSLENSD
jgi:RAT1-interacting protein